MLHLEYQHTLKASNHISNDMWLLVATYICIASLTIIFEYIFITSAK